MDVERGRQIPTEKEDLLTTADYLMLKSNGIYMLVISGLNPDTLTMVLSGDLEESPNREHTRVVGDLTRALMARREITTGVSSRGATSINWLETSKVRTSEGAKTPLEVYANNKLATEARDEIEEHLTRDAAFYKFIDSLPR
jgi:hypothetical protein